jgi:hypothetical protein
MQSLGRALWLYLRRLSLSRWLLSGSYGLPVSQSAVSAAVAGLLRGWWVSFAASAGRFCGGVLLPAVISRRYGLCGVWVGLLDEIAITAGCRLCCLRVAPCSCCSPANQGSLRFKVAVRRQSSGQAQQWRSDAKVAVRRQSSLRHPILQFVA